MVPLIPSQFQNRSPMEFFGFFGEFIRCSPVQSTVGSGLVIRHAPRFDLGPRVIQRQEPVLVQTLLAQAAVERLDVSVIGRLSGTLQG